MWQIVLEQLGRELNAFLFPECSLYVLSINGGDFCYWYSRTHDFAKSLGL